MPPLKKNPIERYTKWGDGTQNAPFILTDTSFSFEEIENYIMRHIYKTSRIVSEKLLAPLHIIDIEYIENNTPKYDKVYFDLSQLFLKIKPFFAELSSWRDLSMKLRFDEYKQEQDH